MDLGVGTPVEGYDAPGPQPRTQLLEGSPTGIAQYEIEIYETPPSYIWYLESAPEPLEGDRRVHIIKALIGLGAASTSSVAASASGQYEVTSARSASARCS